MIQLDRLIENIVTRVNVNLRKPAFDVSPFVWTVIPRDSHSLYYAFYALSYQQPLHFSFNRSSLAGTYFLGRCAVDNSVLYKSDVRGDELKKRGTRVMVGETPVTTTDDEIINIQHSFLVKTLVHNNSHNPESLEVFRILNTVSMHFANIHGSSVEGCFIGPFATVDLSTYHDCVVGSFAYVQAGELSHERIEPGRVWVKADGMFEFDYSFPREVVDKYIKLGEDGRPSGVFVDFVDSRKEDFIPIYSTIALESDIEVPEGSFISHYAVVKNCAIGENVLVAQRAYLENSSLGAGSNAQEHCYIINSTMEGLDVTAHGGKVINCHLGRKVFVGFNSFLHGLETSRAHIGNESIVMPHTIIDAVEPIDIPAGSLVWGYIRTQKDLEENSISLDELSRAKAVSLGGMRFHGLGSRFVESFRHRIEHILEENGAYFDGEEDTKGHAQRTQNVSYNILQPYQEGHSQGMFPPMVIGTRAFGAE